ncbi:histidine phosphotransferase family protein [uncultured Shimia sp.]|uniref:histidine phosphotransferase family protein n=1 Tax=uncultured Shimia sp. TaxID=573152 RepID=UPI002627F3CF|nr:histidine phosphotransferase family protein [uncultured Shimia sp.]
MAQNNMDFSALVGSRICHDLISPVGAIGNGIELIGMSGATGPELELISDSVDNANARIRFFRIAFGYAGEGQMVGSNEVRTVLTDLSEGARVHYLWEVVRDVDRTELRAVFLALMCMETALPYGGKVAVHESKGSWSIGTDSPKLSVDSVLWSDLTRQEHVADITPGRVQFGLLPQILRDTDRELRVSREGDTLSLSF